MQLGYCIFTFEGGDWLRDDFAGLEAGFAHAADLGFDCVEVPSLLVRSRPRTDHEFTHRLGRIFDMSQRHGVALSGVFASVELIDDDGLEGEIDEIMVLARLASSANITYLPMTVGMDRPSDDPAVTRRLADVLSRIASQTLQLGVQLVVHPHIDTPVETPEQIDLLFSHADESVGMCLDVGHIVAGGGDAVAVAQAHRDRVRYVHLKDLDRTAFAEAAGEARYAAFRDPGEGDAPLRPLIDYLVTTGFDGPMLVENDYTPTPVESMVQARAYLAAAGLDR